MRKIILLSLALAMVQCKEETPKPVRNDYNGAALGTSYHIIFFSSAEQHMQKEIDSVFTVINQSLSTYMPDSDISRINKGDSTVVVDGMFRDVFELSQTVHGATNGYFDPTVGTLVNAWGFGPGEQLSLDSTKVDSLLEYVGFHKVRLTDENTVSKVNPNTYFDFNAIAKGYAIDRLALLLDQKGITDYLIEVGGEIVSQGTNVFKEKEWVVGVEDPLATRDRTSKLLLRLKDRALASSGNYRKFRIDSVSGKKYVHTIDPKTGYTKNSNVLGTTVIANSCAEADAYATAFMAMDLEDSIKLLVQQEALDAYIIYLDQKGELQEFMTTGFKELVLP
ncbi:FAD:protein FMN transferase [Flavobacteriaceae bacterium 3-367]|uniref:FAD:protein FMN transferase n=1 Tax=Eudoraea algarum TaxID=3417568 RepID=UPI00326DAACE